MPVQDEFGMPRVTTPPLGSAGTGAVMRAVGELWGDDAADRLDGSQPFRAVAGLGEPELHEFVHVQSMDADALVDLAASRSAVLTMAEPRRRKVLDEVRELAPADEPFELPYRTVLWRSVRS